MRIVLINEYRRKGGSEVQSLRERDALRALGHEVLYITFDPNMDFLCDGDDINIPIHNSPLNLVRRRLFVNQKPKKRLQEIIARFGPDCIHLNNTIAIAATVYKAIEGYPVVQTVRDYSIVCPKGTCIKPDGRACRGYEFENCLACIKANPKFLIKYVCLRSLNRRRKRAVDLFLCPSEALAQCCTDNGIKTSVLNNPFDFTILERHLGQTQEKHYLYYGSIRRSKGAHILMQAWRRFAERHDNAALCFAGEVEDDFREDFEADIGSVPRVEYLGVLSNKEIMSLYDTVYCVVVPSLWLENYPNTVLEALANRTLVVGSDRGGIPELICNEECTFDILDVDSLVDALDYAYRLPEGEYASLVDAGFQRVKENNSLEIYCNGLLAAFDRAIRNSVEKRR